jgi:hypothetical protein
MISPRSFNGPS